MHQVHSSRRAETLDYLRTMLDQLRAMADAERCDMLSYLIEMAHVEASDIIGGKRPPRVGKDQENSVV